MGLLNEQVKRQLTDRFAQTLKDPVQLTLYTRPDSGRLVVPGGLGCPTCRDAEKLAEEVVATAPHQLSLEVVDVSLQETAVADVPTLALSRPDEEPHISWQGLPSGFEFATVVDAIERASSGALGLSPETIGDLGRLTDPLELMVFATPT